MHSMSRNMRDIHLLFKNSKRNSHKHTSYLTLLQRYVNFHVHDVWYLITFAEDKTCFKT